MKIRKAELKDLDHLVDFTMEEAREAEGLEKPVGVLRNGIEVALIDNSVAMYWVIMDTKGEPIGSVSVTKEWSDWNAGFYWWIQSMYLRPAHRGKGLMRLMLASVKDEMIKQNGLELRLYVHSHNQIAISAYEKAGFASSKYRIMVLGEIASQEDAFT